MEADLDQLRLIFALYQRYDPAIDTDEIYAEIADPPARGARLRARGRHMALYRADAARRGHVHVPGAGARAVDGAAADDGLARGRAAARP